MTARASTRKAGFSVIEKIKRVHPGLRFDFIVHFNDHGSSEEAFGGGRLLSMEAPTL